MRNAYATWLCRLVIPQKLIYRSHRRLRDDSHQNSGYITTPDESTATAFIVAHSLLYSHIGSINVLTWHYRWSNHKIHNIDAFIRPRAMIIRSEQTLWWLLFNILTYIIVFLNLFCLLPVMHVHFSQDISGMVSDNRYLFLRVSAPERPPDGSGMWRCLHCAYRRSVNQAWVLTFQFRNLNGPSFSEIRGRHFKGRSASQQGTILREKNRCKLRICLPSFNVTGLQWRRPMSASSKRDL